MKNLIACLLFLISSSSFAMFCPTNFNMVNLGDSLATVLQQCGEPVSKNNLKKTSNLSEEWNYYVKTQFNEATTKLKIVFMDNRIINISIKDPNENRLKTSIMPGGVQATGTPSINIAYNNGNQEARSVGSTSLCGSLIKIGDSMDIVANTCGKPVSINQNKNPYDSANATQIVELKYDGPNAATLIFENGILKKKI